MPDATPAASVAGALVVGGPGRPAGAVIRSLDQAGRHRDAITDGRPPEGPALRVPATQETDILHDHV